MNTQQHISTIPTFNTSDRQLDPDPHGVCRCDHPTPEPIGMFRAYQCSQCHRMIPSIAS